MLHKIHENAEGQGQTDVQRKLLLAGIMTIYGKAFKKLKTQNASGENGERWVLRRCTVIVCPVSI